MCRSTALELLLRRLQLGSEPDTQFVLGGPVNLELLLRRVQALGFIRQFPAFGFEFPAGLFDLGQVGGRGRVIGIEPFDRL